MPSFKFASATGSGSSLIVTCSDQFAGKTITCTNGTKTYTRTCPSTSPYEVVFKGVAPGTWTVSGVVEGTTYSQQVVITDFDVTLTAGFDYKQWVTLGGLDPTDYASLSEVFADEVAVRRLMTIHASADYLIEKVTDDIDMIDDFTANDTAMKWIGLRDYVCDGLTAIAGVEAKFLASQYWERYLKDHVPVMTSNTAPYGNTVAPNEGSNTPTYYAFDGNPNTNATNNAIGHTEHGIGYKFVNPICPKKATIYLSTAYTIDTLSIQGSNDGTNWVNISEVINNPTQGINLDIPLNTSEYYLYVRARMTGPTSSRYGVYTLQFYGRALDVSVPVMTSNTAPFGEAFASSERPIYGAYLAFSEGSRWITVQGQSTNQHVGYKFISPMVIRKFRTYGVEFTYSNCKLEASNNGVDWTTIHNFGTLSGDVLTWADVDNDTPYLYYRLVATSSGGNVSFNCTQFYGLDYSEREFAEGSTMKYLYDHGVELETINTTGTATKGDDYITLSAANAQASHTLDLTSYDLLRGKVGDHMSGTTALIAGTTATANMTAANAPNNESLNVSSVNASLATGAKMTGAGVCDITELWLE